jgi:uncharacterized protein with von Willebrand factor type A (vWA) domain
MLVRLQAHEARDLALAEQQFQALGWRDEGPEGSVATDELLAALLRRAAAYKAVRDKVHEQERDKVHGAAAAAGGAPVAFDWDTPPFR